MDYTQEQFDKLPKWARLEMNRLDRDLNGALEQIRALGNSDSSIKWRVGIGDYHGIPEYATVTFLAGEGHFDVSTREDYGRTVLEITGNYTLHIEPKASNNIYLVTEEN